MSGSRRVLAVVTALAATAIGLTALTAQADTVPASRRTSYPPNVMFPVAGSRAVDLRTFGSRPGTEIKAPCGTVVRASTPGTIHLSRSRTAGPHLVRVVTSTGRLVTWYGYMGRITVTDRQIIQAGQQVGYVGHAGIARRCALYFATTTSSGAVTMNPSRWLDRYVGQPTPSISLFDNNGFILATLNTLGASHTTVSSRSTYATYDVRTPRQVALLGRYGVDVVGLQEFQKPQRTLFLQTAGSTYGIFPTDKMLAADPKTDTENSIIWRNTTMQFISGDTIDVPYFTGIRKMPVILLKDKRSGREAYFINVHNPASNVGYGDQTANRAKAIAVERAEVISLRATGKAVFLTGDLNDRAAAFCPLTAGKLMISANSIPSTACAMPTTNYGIDWVLAAGQARFNRFGYDWTPKLLGLTDHPIVWTRAHIAAQ